jgi:hypothetical protein
MASLFTVSLLGIKWRGYENKRIILEIADMVAINSLVPQDWGTFFISGGTPPDPRQEVSCTSLYCNGMSHSQGLETATI